MSLSSKIMTSSSSIGTLLHSVADVFDELHLLSAGDLAIDFEFDIDQDDIDQSLSYGTQG